MSEKYARGKASAKKVAVAQRRKAVTDLYLKGHSQMDIADRFSVTQQTISKDLRFIREQWLSDAVLNMDELKTVELAKLDHLERQYWSAWEKSVSKIENQYGDPRFLNGVHKCIESRVRILGLEAPRQLNVRLDVHILQIVGQLVEQLEGAGLSPSEVFERMLQKISDESRD